MREEVVNYFVDIMNLGRKHGEAQLGVQFVELSAVDQTGSQYYLLLTHTNTAIALSVTQPRQREQEQVHQLFVLVVFNDHNHRLQEGLHPQSQVSLRTGACQERLTLELLVEHLGVSLHTVTQYQRGGKTLSQSNMKGQKPSHRG